MKKFASVLLLLIMLVITLTAVGCGGEDKLVTFDGSATATEMLQSIVNVIQRGDHVHTPALVPGMDDESFKPVEEAISAVVKGADPKTIEITLVESECKHDIDNNPYFYGTFNIKCASKSVDVIVVYPKDDTSIYTMKLK